MRAAVIAGLAFGGWLLARIAQAADDPENRLSVDRARDLVRIALSETPSSFSEADVLAVIEIESGFNPDAYRFEPSRNDASIGLMQVLFATAKDRGFVGSPAGLFDPLTNIRIGVRHLAWTEDFLRRRGISSREVVVGAYNAGVGNAINGFTPQGYVAKWQRARARYV